MTYNNQRIYIPYSLIQGNPDNFYDLVMVYILFLEIKQMSELDPNKLVRIPSSLPLCLQET